MNTLWLFVGSLLPSIAIIYHVINIIIKMFGIKLFIVSDRIAKKKLSKQIMSNSIYSQNFYSRDEHIAGGLFFWYNYVGIIHMDEIGYDVYQIYIYTTQTVFDLLISKNENCDDDENMEEKCGLTIYERDGEYKNMYYNRRSITLDKLVPTTEQENIIDEIKKVYEKKHRGVFYIHGKPGSGKTTLALLLAQSLNGSLCKTFNPTEPNNTMTHLVGRAEPEYNKPLIILLDEVNIIIKNIHNEYIQRHIEIPIMVYNKSTFNRFLDDIMFFPNVIILMTSNESVEEINKLDSSYLRKKRVHKDFIMNSNLIIDE